MITLYEVLDQRLNNRTLDFTDRTGTLAAGHNVMFRLRLTEVSAGANISVSMDVTFPSGRVKHFDLYADAVGSYERGGWSGGPVGGAISASGVITVNGRITLDAYIVAFEQGEDVLEWV